MEILFKDNENLVSIGDPDTGLGGLKNIATGVWVNDATVTLAGIRDAAGNYVAGTTNLVMPYVAGTNGRYQASTPNTIAIIAGAPYVAVIDITSGGVDAHWETPLMCRIRTS